MGTQDDLDDIGVDIIGHVPPKNSNQIAMDCFSEQLQSSKIENLTFESYSIIIKNPSSHRYKSQLQKFKEPLLDLRVGPDAIIDCIEHFMRRLISTKLGYHVSE